MPFTLLFLTIKMWRGGDGRDKMVHKYSIYLCAKSWSSNWRTEKEVEDIVLQTSVFLNEKIIFSRNV